MTMKQKPRAALSLTASLALVPLAACSGGSFHTQARSLPATSTVIHDPIPTATLEDAGGDGLMLAKMRAFTSDENALRLLQSWCNYDDLFMGYKTAGKIVVSEQQRCADLRAWEAEQAKGADDG